MKDVQLVYISNVSIELQVEDISDSDYNDCPFRIKEKYPEKSGAISVTSSIQNIEF